MEIFILVNNFKVFLSLNVIGNFIDNNKFNLTPKAHPHLMTPNGCTV